MLSLVYAHTSIMSVTDHDDDRMGNEETTGWGWMDAIPERSHTITTTDRPEEREREQPLSISGSQQLTTTAINITTHPSHPSLSAIHSAATS
jgi:hypothetical protein